ncbi:MAG: hypothetical protein QOG54_2809 [Actinomycetota bacterium]|jgi:hypothetical protein|nr:hypothetical protein [Actinomycetota bacterium]
MNDRFRLFLLSFLMLFLEIALIRWTGSNVIYLSYFSNFVLMGSFLGIGVGFLRADKRDLFPLAPLLLLLLVVFIEVFPVEINREGADLIYFGALPTTGLPIWVTLPVIFLAVAATMTAVAQGVARTFQRLEPLDAYRFDILGSIAGVVFYVLISWIGTPPAVWGSVVVVCFAILLRPPIRSLAWVPLIAIVAAFTVESLAPDTYWSPYYKISVDYFEGQGEGVIGVFVNGILHQTIETTAAREQTEPIYFVGYERLKDNPLDDVLVVGAGNGTDVAIALDKGAKHVDAVEIDPRLQEVGRDLHPDRPYQDPRVDVHIDDGRAFLERTDKSYDLIEFALPDSLTLISGQSSLRLESYLFTLEAMKTAREHLKPGGAFTMYNFYREAWLIDRLAGTLYEAYGHAPCLDNSIRNVVLATLTITKDPTEMECPVEWKPSPPPPAAATDDWPFLYLINRNIPFIYLAAIGMILLVSLILVRTVGGRFSDMAPYRDLFFMGAAFLLLETKSVVRFALLFGTTWFVNAIVFVGVLLAVLLAIEVARRRPNPDPRVLYALLIGSLFAAWAIPEHLILELAFLPRIAAAIVVTFTPIFLANLVFAQRFKDVAASTVAFGANLIGAMVGGVMEYSALLIGYRALLIIVAVLYGLAYFYGQLHVRGRGSPTGALVEGSSGS